LRGEIDTLDRFGDLQSKWPEIKGRRDEKNTCKKEISFPSEGIPSFLPSTIAAAHLIAQWNRVSSLRSTFGSF
jgi:hypothetical protein